MDQFRVDAPGARLEVRRSDDDGEPLLLLHGGPGVPDYMQSSTAPMLTGFRCISFDQRGVGASACLDGRYDLAAYLDDIEAVRTRIGAESWHVLGHSWGGLLAQAYTSAHPQRVKSLALVSSSLGVGTEWAQTKRESFWIACSCWIHGHPSLLCIRFRSGDPRIYRRVVDASRDDRDVAQLLLGPQVRTRSRPGVALR